MLRFMASSDGLRGYLKVRPRYDQDPQTTGRRSRAGWRVHLQLLGQFMLAGKNREQAGDHRGDKE